MTSVLAQQLAQLAAAQGPQARFIRGKPSLLYDYQKAADVGAETLLDIAQQGLEVLVRLDSRFKPFAQSLFSRSSLTVTRDQLTKEENEQLDRSLRAFLQLLSNHFLTPAAFQVLEYCIRRYKVNELNVHDLVLCALPFHATNEFVRLVQTLSLKGTPWEWLTPMQASGAAMPRSVLVTRCDSDPVVLSSICKAAEAMGAPRCLSRTFLSTYAVTVCEVLMAASPEVPEQLLRQLVPFLVAGLRRSASLDYRAATLMIVTQLCSVAQLGSEVLTVLVGEVCAGATPEDPRTPLMLLAHIALTQTSLQELPQAAVQAIAELPGVAEAIVGLQQQGARMHSLLQLLLPALTAAAADSPEAQQLLCDLLHKVALPAELVQETAAQLLLEGGKHYRDAAQGAPNSSRKQAAAAEAGVERLQQVCRVLDLRWAQQLDTAINQVLQQGADADHDASVAEGVFRFVQEACGAQHSMVNCAGQTATLAAAVGAPAAAMRVMALRQLDALVAESAEPSPASQELLVAGLLSGLLDDSFAVAAAAAGAAGLALVPPQELLHALQQLSARAVAAAAASKGPGSPKAGGSSPGGAQQAEDKDGSRKEAVKAAKRALQAAAQLGERDAPSSDAAAGLVLGHLLVTSRKGRKVARASLEAASSMGYHPLMAALAESAAADPVLGAGAAAEAAKPGKSKQQAAAAEQGAADDVQYNAHVVRAVAAALRGAAGLQPASAVALAAAAGPLGQHLLALALCCHDAGAVGGAAQAISGKRSKKTAAAAAGGGTPCAPQVLAQLALYLAVPEWAAGTATVTAPPSVGGSMGTAKGAAGLPPSALAAAGALLDAQGLPAARHQELLQSGGWQQQAAALKLAALQQQLQDVPGSVWAEAVADPVRLFACLVAVAPPVKAGPSAVVPVLQLLVDKVVLGGQQQQQQSAVGLLSEVYGLPAGVAGASVQVAALQVLAAMFEAAAGGKEVPAGAAESPAWLLRLLAAAASGEPSVRSASVAAAAAVLKACQASPQSPVAGDTVTGAQLVPLLEALVSQQQLVQQNSTALRLLLQHVAAGQQEAAGVASPPRHGKGSKGKASSSKVSLSPDLVAHLPALGKLLTHLLVTQLPHLTSPSDWAALQLAAAVLASSGRAQQQQVMEAVVPALQQLGQLLLGGGVVASSPSAADTTAVWEQLVGGAASNPAAALTAAAVAAAQQLLSAMSEGALPAAPGAVDLLCHLLLAGHTSEGWSAAVTAEGLAVASPVRAAAVALVSPEVYAGVSLGHQEQLLKGLVLMAAADGDQACREAAQRALEALPLTAAVLQLPLQRLQLGLTGQSAAAAAAAAPTPSKRRRTTKAGEQPAAAAAAGGPLTAVDVALATAVLELLQWSSSVEHPEQLVGPLQALLQACLPRLGTIVEAHAEGAQPASSTLLPPALVDTAAAADGDEDASPLAADAAAGEAASPASLGYIAQLVLQVLQQLAGQLPKGTKARPSSSSSSAAAADFDVALVLEVARGAPDAAVRNAALSLWGALAARSPEGMLGYVLQALTLIHESAAVYDDSHSHRVTSDTLAAVVPPWLAAGHPAQQLWSTLVEALPQLPPHRRLGLLTALLAALPQDQGLWVALLLLLRKAEEAAAAPAAAGDDAAAAATGDSWWLQLASTLCAKVPAAERVEAFGRLLSGCLADPPAAPSAPLPRLVVAFVTRQLPVKVLLGAAAAATSAPTPPEVQAACAGVLQQAVLLLQQLHPGAAASASASSSPTSPKGGAKKLQRAVKAATAGLYDLLRALSAIIDAAAYLRVLVQLVASSGSEKVVRKALQLFADRMDKVELDLVDLEGLPAGQRKQAEAQLAEAALQLLTYAPQLLDAAATPSALTRQHALLACQTAVRAFGAQQPGTLVAVVPGVLAAAKDGTAAVRASALACVAALVGALGTQLIGQLPAVAAAVLAAAEAACGQLSATSAKQQQQQEGSDEEEAGDAATGQAALELASALAALEALVGGLGAFMSPYLPRLVQLLVHPAVLGCSTAGAADTAARLRVLLPSAVPARLLLEPLSAQWEHALELSLSDATLAGAAGAPAAGAEAAHQPAAVLLGMVVDLVSGLETKLAAVYYEGVFGLLLKALDTRRRWMETCSSSSGDGGAAASEGVAALGPAGVHEVETAAARALVALTMKLSESRFKPLFLRLLDWAASSLGAAVAAAQSAAAAGEDMGAAAGGDGGLGRTVALLTTVVALSHRLRSVFVPYFKYILDLLLAQLTGAAAAAAGVKPPKKKRRKSAAAASGGEAGSSKDAALQLAVWLARVRSVQALHLLFIHSSGSEQQQKQEQLERVLQPLVDQLLEGPAVDGASPGTHQLLSLLSQQCADAELDVHGGPVAALGEAGEAAVAAIGGPLPDSVTDVAGLAAVGALLAGALSTGSDLSWKPVHHSVLVATRKGGVRAKLLALGLLSRLVASLQEEYLVLLPEALPFIAELLEDPDASVEGAVQGVVAQLEKVSGESLQQYLKV